MEWRLIEESNGEYFINENGQVRRNDLILKATLNRHGYYCVRIRDKDGELITRLLHRLLAITFIPNNDNLPVVNHINGNKTDNRLSNLEWVTQKENINKAWENGLCSSRSGEKNGHAKLTSEDVKAIRSMFDIDAVAEKYGVRPVTISGILLRHSWKDI